MKESIGYTVTLNIVIMFIIIVFAFLSAALIYYKSNKTSNVIVDSIEKYEGYNDFAKEEIALKVSSLGYTMSKVSCGATTDNNKCNLVSGSGDNGYCVYECNEKDYYYYRVKTNMRFNVPIINNMLRIPIFSNTNRMYNFDKLG